MATKYIDPNNEKNVLGKKLENPNLPKIRRDTHALRPQKDLDDVNKAKRKCCI